MPYNAQTQLSMDLVSLALERAPEKRLELLRRVTDAYLDHGATCSNSEQYFFEEVIASIVEKLDRLQKAEAARKLATLAEMSEFLARKLGSDGDIDVAGPIIRDYRGMPQAVLVDIAKDGSQDHLNLIAGRPVLTPPVTDVVVARGDSKTMRTLASNEGARFSARGMNEMIAKARNDADLQARIVARNDLTMGAVAELLPIISDELANRLRGLAIEVDQSRIADHIGDWAADRKANIERTDAYIERIRRNDLKLDDVVVDLVFSKRLFDSAAVIGAMTGLDRTLTFNILAAGSLESAILLMRSVELTWRAAEAFLRLRKAKGGAGAFETMPARIEYEAIDIEGAQRVVRFMKVRRTVELRPATMPA